MKTLKEVLDEIIKVDQQANEIIPNEEPENTDKRQNAARKQLFTMRLARNYLEFNPTKESVINQKEEVTRYLEIYENRYLEYEKRNEKIKVTKAMFNKAAEIDTKELSKWKSELKFLNYILS